MNEEYQIQIAVVRWLQIEHPTVLFTIAPNGMKLNIGQAVKLKRMGYSKGTPDIMIFEPKGKYHGLFIELKTATGRTTPEQEKWISDLSTRNYRAIICRSYNEAIGKISEYLLDSAEIF